MSRFVKTKRAAEVLDYTFDWLTKEWLESDETIATSSWVASDGITVDTDTNTTTTTTVWVSGGTSGQTYKLTNTITTSNSPSRTGVREMYLKIL
jgi:hypothetical protein